MRLVPDQVAVLRRIVAEEHAASGDQLANRDGCEELAARIRARLPAGWGVRCEIVPFERCATVTLSPPVDRVTIDAIRHALRVEL